MVVKVKSLNYQISKLGNLTRIYFTTIKFNKFTKFSVVEIKIFN